MTTRAAFRTLAALSLAVPCLVLAKLPPLSDEAKAKAAEAAAKTAWTGKVDNYKLCKSMDAVAARYHAEAKKAGKDVKAETTPPCADPGPFVYEPAPAAPAAAAPAAPAKAPEPAPKK